MRRQLLISSAALAAAACVYNPDPRRPSAADVERSSFGAWIVVIDRRDTETHGELISVEPALVRVLAWRPEQPVHRPGVPGAPAVVRPGATALAGKRAAEPDRLVEHPVGIVDIPRTDIVRARLFRYTADSFNGWGLAGSLSTITHLYLAVVTLPVWIISWSAAESSESRHAVLDYPRDRMEEIAMWARFPQGMPPGFDPRALVPAGAARAAR